MSKGESDYTNINSYRSSRFFVEAVKNARDYEPSLDDLVIFAGACQSFYEALIEAGANFASSPHRVLIHALDPVFICEKVAFASINKVLSIQEAISNTITGIKGIGGLETRGKYRQGFPKSPFV
jgi:spore coat assembly protein